jgi:cellobiose phosphorylase
MLQVEPCIPSRWPGYEVTYRYRSATYQIRVENPAGAGRGVRSVLVDGQAVPDGVVPLRDDGREHDVRVTLDDGKR